MGKQKILIVDDDLHIAELISLYMMKDGYETEEVVINPVIMLFLPFKLRYV